jgi:hypothetical protein
MNTLTTAELERIMNRVDRKMSRLTKGRATVPGFSAWLNTFIDEKGIDRETVLEVESENGTANAIPVGCLLEAMEAAPAHEQAAIKSMIIKIDFVNGDVLHYFSHLARAIACSL